MDLIFASPLQKQAATQNEAVGLLRTVGYESTLIEGGFRSGAGILVRGFVVELSGLMMKSEVRH